MLFGETVVRYLGEPFLPYHQVLSNGEIWLLIDAHRSHVSYLDKSRNFCNAQVTPGIPVVV